MSSKRPAFPHGRMTMTGDPPIGNWNAGFIETTMPGKQRWDLTIAASSWTVAFDGTNVRSKGDKRLSGTAFGQELEKSIRLFSSLRLPSILPAIQSGYRMIKQGNETGPILVAESPMDRFTFNLSETYTPEKVLHEHLIVPSSREDGLESTACSERSQAATHRILRYPDRPARADSRIRMDTTVVKGPFNHSFRQESILQSCKTASVSNRVPR